MIMWNYKCAVLSAIFRSALFFSTNLVAGFDAAVGAMIAEFAFRFTTAGFYGALTQAFGRIRPRRLGTLAALMVLPALAHSLELLIHWWRATPELAASIAASVAFTIISTAFNLFAMRRGLLVVGSGQQSLWCDMRDMPKTIAAFLRLRLA